jgi:FAD/FMN-containing dehydrogenase
MTSETDIARMIDELSQRLSGTLLQPGDPRYPRARRVWNAAIDRRPAAIAVCADAEDVALAVRVGAEHGSALTVRGGGHNVAGRSISDGSLLIDLSRLRHVEINAKSQVASVQGGALWHDVDLAGAQHSLFTTGGLVSSTGVGGFTLGGGTGWLMRQHGLAIDNLIGAEVVLADGRYVSTSAADNPELFYALRGGAGSLGVITRFDFKVHPVQRVLAGIVIRPLAEAGAALRVFRDFARHAPAEYCGMTVLTHAPSLPFLDAAWHGQPVCISAMCWSGDVAAGERTLEPLRRNGKVLVDHVATVPYVQWQHTQDAGAPPGRHQYWKTSCYEGLSDAAIELLVEFIADCGSPFTEVHVQHLGGAVAMEPEVPTAFSARNAAYFVNLIGVTPWADELPEVREGIRVLHSRLLPHALSTLMPNFSSQEDGDPATQLGAEQGARVAAIRRRYDPQGLFSPPPKS